MPLPTTAFSPVLPLFPHTILDLDSLGLTNLRLLSASLQLASSTCTPALQSITSDSVSHPCGQPRLRHRCWAVLVGLPGGSPQECGLESWSVSCVFSFCHLVSLVCQRVADSQPNLHVLHCHIALCPLHTVFVHLLRVQTV